jgi:hypothetical protein
LDTVFSEHTGEKKKKLMVDFTACPVGYFECMHVGYLECTSKINMAFNPKSQLRS